MARIKRVNTRHYSVKFHVLVQEQRAFVDKLGANAAFKQPYSTKVFLKLSS